MKKTSPVFIILGRPGAGKTAVSSQYSTKSEKYPTIHFGQTVREMALRGNPIAVRLSKLMSQAKPYDLPDMIAVLSHILDQNKRYQNGFILDGFPRGIGEVELFDAFLQKRGLHIARAINFKINKKQSIRRQMIRGRDSKETISEREKGYLADEIQLVEYYRKKGLLKTLRAMDFKRRKNDATSDVVKVQANNLGRIIRAASRKINRGKRA